MSAQVSTRTSVTLLLECHGDIRVVDAGETACLCEDCRIVSPDEFIALAEADADEEIERLQGEIAYARERRGRLIAAVRGLA